MIRLLAVATGRDGGSIVQHLDRSAGDIEVALHLGGRKGIRPDIKASSMSRLDMGSGRLGHVMQDGEFIGAAQSLMQAPDAESKLDTFMDQLHRYSPSASYRTHQLHSMYDYMDYWHILSDRVAGMIESHGITHCLFFNIPHLTYDFVVNQVASAMGIPSVILTHSLFPNQFYSMADVGDYGCFPDGDAPPMSVDTGGGLDLFYMNSVGQSAGASGHITPKSIMQLMAHLATRRPLKAFDVPWLLRTVRRMHAVHRAFPSWRDPFAKFFHEDALAYFEHLAQYERAEVDLNRRFVYFPLQYQPEMTTSAVGGVFRDQALAIESLSRRLPQDVLIYVKENPKQGGFMRGPMFFHRLSRIPNVRIMPSFADTKVLTANSECIATITGTVGWEAICMGKPAIVFGSTWYQGFSGVTSWSEDFDFDSCVSGAIDHAAIEHAAGQLTARAHSGVASRHFARQLKRAQPDFDAAANEAKVAATIGGLLRGEVEFTFQK